MPAPTFVGHDFAGGPGSVSPSIPTGAQTGDLLFLHIEGEGEDGNADPAGAGWTLVATAASDEGGLPYSTRVTLYYCVYDSGSPPSLTVPDAGDHTLAVISAWRGVNQINPIAAFGTDSDATFSSSHTVSSGVETTLDGQLVILFGSYGDDHAPHTPVAAGLDSISTAYTRFTNAGSDGACFSFYGPKASAGAVGDISYTAGGAEYFAAVVVALNEHGTGDPSGGSHMTLLL